jgi:hypothetical protein
MTLSEDERMRQVLDNDECQRQNEARYADLLHTDQSQRSFNDSAHPHDASGNALRRWPRSSGDSTAGRFYDWPDSESKGSYSRVGEDGNDNQEQLSGILSVLAANCLPGSATSSHTNNTETRRKKSFLPIVLLTLILYGTISMILDVTNSITTLNKSRMMDTDDKVNKMSMLKQVRSFDLSTEIDEPMQPTKTNILTMSDIPHLTEQILSENFQHVLEYNKNDLPYENEIPFYWTLFGGDTTVYFKAILQCFPNVVQASGGDIIGTAGEESIRKFPREIKILQQRLSLGDENGITIDGGKYINVDLFTPEGTIRATDLNLLYPSAQYSLLHEHDFSSVIPISADRTMTASGSSPSKLASQQINLIVSPFLSSELFSSNDNTSPEISPPKAKVHAIMLPTGHRLRAYHHLHVIKGGTKSFLEFITSPTILANNHVTRVLSRQEDINEPVTDMHLDIAKSVISRKIHMWPNRGVQDMLSLWANLYGWQEGALQIRDQLLSQQMQQSNHEMVLGMECVFPPPDPNLPPQVQTPPREPTDLEVEINRVIAERNALDDRLFLYVVQLYDSWMTES